MNPTMGLARPSALPNLALASFDRSDCPRTPVRGRPYTCFGVETVGATPSPAQRWMDAVFLGVASADAASLRQSGLLRVNPDRRCGVEPDVLLGAFEYPR